MCISNSEESDSDYQRMEVENNFSATHLSHDEVLTRLGGCGCFAKLAALIFVSAMITGDLIVNNLAFFELIPVYECQTADGTWQECTRQEFCVELGAP